MSAVIPRAGEIRPLDGRAQPEEAVTNEQVTDPDRLSRLLRRLLSDVAVLKRRWWPDALEFEGRTVDATGTVLHRFPHGLGAAVRWWPVDWIGAAGPQLSKHEDTDLNTLVLVSFVEGTVCLRVEVSG